MLNCIIETKLVVSSLFISGACNMSVMGSCGPDYIFLNIITLIFYLRLDAATSSHLPCIPISSGALQNYGCAIK